MDSVSPAEPAVQAVGRDINCILRSGRVAEPQAETLQAAFRALEFCSVGVHVREYGTVITTDNIANAGFVDLSLHPLRLSLVGCVITRGTAYHDNVSTHRSGVPADITWPVQRYGIKCAVCIPIKLAALMSEGSTVASEHVLGTLTLGSCKLNGVTQEHRRLAEAQQTKVQLLYTLVIISTATCVGYLTPSQERGLLLIWPPFLQLLPLVFLSFNPSRYYRNSEVMHVLLNITKTIWAVCYGVPRLGPFWTPGRRLAIAWKFGLDCLMVSGLGELARFSTFVWVQALDLGNVGEVLHAADEGYNCTGLSST
ncbi:hypothetical protein WJX79_007839 [Trebouxia sp. C0005]